MEVFLYLHFPLLQLCIADSDTRSIEAMYLSHSPDNDLKYVTKLSILSQLHGTWAGQLLHHFPNVL